MTHTVGSTWLTRIRGQQWPVVLCDSSTVPAAFPQTRLQPNHIPAFQLGRRRCVWIAPEGLVEYNPNEKYVPEQTPFAEKDIHPQDSEDVKLEKQRHIAFNQDALEMRDHKWWFNYKKSEIEARKIDSARKRKRQSDFREQRSRADSAMSISDDDRESSTSRRRRQTKKPSGAVVTMSDYEHDSDSDNIVVTSWRSTKAKETAFKTGGLAIQGIEGDDNAISEGALLTPPLSQKGFQDPGTPTTDQCKVILAEAGEITSVNLDREGIGQCPYLHSLEAYSQEQGYYQVNLTSDPNALNLKLTAAELQALSAFFKTGDISPLWIQAKGIKKLSPLSLDSGKKNQHAETLAPAFVTAVKLRHEALQNLILAKLIHLEPLPPAAIFTVAFTLGHLPDVESHVEAKMCSWIVAQMVNSYWDLVRFSDETLRRILEGDEGLRTAVYQGMAAKRFN